MIKQITEITCDVCGVKMPTRYGVSLKTGRPRPCVEADIPTHEIDLCHKCACKALHKGMDSELHDYSPVERYRQLMEKYFPKVKRINS